MRIKETVSSADAPILSLFGLSALSVVDGPGKRTVVFFQGCDSQCAWCHSPHSQPKSSPMFFRAESCTMCMRCVEACRFGVHVFSKGCHNLHRALCQKCGRCIEACPRSAHSNESGVLYLPTKRVDPDSLLKQLHPCLLLCDGITLSGGEPLLQTEAIVSFLKLCKSRGIQTALETSGLLDPQCYVKASPYVDIWLFGVRVVTDATKRFHTNRILSNLQCILEQSKGIVLPRIPMVPGVTDQEEVLEEIHRVLKSGGLHEVWLNPWNRFFDVNYTASGMEQRFSAPHEELIQRCEAKINAFFLSNHYEVH